MSLSHVKFDHHVTPTYLILFSQKNVFFSKKKVKTDTGDLEAGTTEKPKIYFLSFSNKPEKKYQNQQFGAVMTHLL